MKRVLVAVTLLALAVPQAAWAKGEFHPEEEFAQHEWVSIHLGPLNMSITKTVAYLLLGTVVTIFVGLFFMRGPTLSRRGTTGELIYDIAQTQVAEQGLPSKAMGRWFPYVATLMLFIFVVNLLGFIPLRISAYWVIGMFVILQLWNLGSTSKSEIAYWAHFGGMLGGAILFPLMKPPGVRLFQCLRPVPDTVVRIVPDRTARAGRLDGLR